MNQINCNENNKENEPTIESILQRSFELIWYQAEVLHEREMDLLKEKFTSLEMHSQQTDDLVRDRIMMFSQDIIATMKDMICTLREEFVWRYIGSNLSVDADSARDLLVAGGPSEQQGQPQPSSLEGEAEELRPLEVEAAKEQLERVVEAVVGDCHPLLAQRL